MDESKKAWYKKWWAITLFVLIALIIIGSILPNDSNPTGSTINNLQNNQPKQNVSGISDAQKIVAVNKTLYDAGYTQVWKIEKTTNSNGAQIVDIVMVSTGKNESEVSTQLGTAIGVLNAGWPDVDYYLIGMVEGTTLCIFTITTDKVNQYIAGQISASKLYYSITPTCQNFS